MTLISSPTATARSSKKRIPDVSRVALRAFLGGASRGKESRPKMVSAFLRGFLFSSFFSHPRFIFFSFFLFQTVSARLQINNEWGGKTVAKAWDEKKAHGLSLKRPPKKKRRGEAKPAPSLLSQRMGLVSARALWLGLGGSFPRFEFAA